MKAKRYSSLQSNGPIFPEAYEVKGYKVQGIALPPLAEEMLWAAARLIENTEYWPKLVSAGNFWSCLKPELPKNMTAIFPADFMPTLKKMKAKQEQIKADKKLLTKDDRLAIKAENEAKKEKYGFVELDGQKVAITGYLIEAPSIILTRGKDPRFGNWKYRVEEKDVILNIVKGKAPAGWKGKVISDPTGMWVLRYQVKCGIDGGPRSKKLNKRICFSSSSSVWQKSNNAKFDKTTDILKNWNKIQKHIYDGCLDSEDQSRQESALIAYLIQQTGIRIGGGRDLKLVADTKGASTLMMDNVELL